ncbi:MAG TPA: two-component regulator propeller domain-containing protein [Bryobacteraceae bacterium]|nr:two-component regulator propeller domain-containing protein [Bryobacteraceae bacterium]
MGWRAILVLLAAFPSFVKSELLPIRAYTTADGLAADHIDCIVSDSRGFLWFCTPEGLSRFDGYHFVSYGVDEGLPHRRVSTLIETRSGDYFVGTARGISRINPASQGARFATYAPEQQPSQNNVAALQESRSGKIWCATRSSLFEWNRAGSFRRREFMLPPEAFIGNIVEDPRGDLWIGTISGIYRLGDNGVAQSFTVKDGLPGNWVEMLLLDSKGRLWAALRGGLALITRQATGTWSLEKTYSDKSGLVGTDVKAVAEASDGTLWVGTTQGISRLRLGAGEPAVFQNLTRAQGLSDRSITTLAEDQAGNIWAGTEGAGVMRIDRLGFTTYREQDGLPTDRVFSVFEDQAGELLAVTPAAGRAPYKSVDIFDGARFHSVIPKLWRTWGWHQIVLQRSSGEWWAVTKEGLCRYPAMKAAELDGRSPRICYSPEDEFFRIFEDSKGGIWASAQSKSGDQLVRWDPRSNSVFVFPPKVPGERSDDLVGAFAEDRQGNIWMGLYKGGLYRYDGHGFQHFQQSDGVPSGTILTLLASEDGLWIGSNGGGLGRIENTADKRPHIEIYNTAHGLASNTIDCLVKDRQGRIYAGTGKGVDRLDPKTGHIRHFSSANGLAHGEFTSAVRDRSGSLWFATKQGLSRLATAGDRPPVKPRVFITDLRIGGAAYPLSQLGETRVSPRDLKPSQNQLQVEFVGIDYEPGDVLRYSYKLEGADKDWTPPRDQHVVNYAALTDGRYRFLVKAVTSEGAESAAPAEIDFTVLPPIWKRWWFLSLALALAIALVFAAHRYRLAQMVNLERMRTAIATDLHDDIGASLSQIAILSEVARVGGNGEGRPGEPLERVATLARELVDSMGDIVWSIRSEPRGVDSLIRRMREFALDLLGSQGIDFELRTPPTGENVQLSLQARRQLFLMFKECIHNAARHSGCTAVVAELKVVDREVTLTIEDNGSGLNSTERAPGSVGGTGIPNMRRRAESLGGRMQMTSKPGEGCLVSIHLPAHRGALARARL